MKICLSCEGVTNTAALRCGHCGRKLHVAYSGTNGNTGRYHCRGAMINHGTDPCISFGSLRVDQAVGGEIVRLLQPLGVEAALHAERAKQRPRQRPVRKTERMVSSNDEGGSREEP